MDPAPLSIGEVAQRAGLSVDAIRYYEREGVLPPAERDAGGRRHYDRSILDALVLVGALRAVGFGIVEIRRLTQLKGEGTVVERLRAVLAQCDDLDAALDARARELRAARRVVRTMRHEAEALLADPPVSC